MYNPNEEYEAMIIKLKQICKEKDISPYALAKKAEISTSTMSYLMSGKTKPELYTILSICNVLQINIGDLFGEKKKVRLDEAQKQFLTKEEIELLHHFTTFS